MIPEDATRVAYLLTGQVDIISAPPPREFNRLRPCRTSLAPPRPTLGGALLMFTNNLKPPLDDVNFRKALSCAIDRKTIADKVYYGLPRPDRCARAPARLVVQPGGRQGACFDLDRAEEFLGQVEISERRGDRYQHPGRALSARYQGRGDLPAGTTLAKIGVKINLKVYEFSVLIQHRPRRAPDGDAGLHVAGRGRPMSSPIR